MAGSTLFLYMPNVFICAVLMGISYANVFISSSKSNKKKAIYLEYSYIFL